MKSWSMRYAVYLPYTVLSLLLAFIRPINVDEAVCIDYALGIAGRPYVYPIGWSSIGILLEPPLYYFIVAPLVFYPILGRIASFFMGLASLVILRRLGGAGSVLIFSLIPVFLVHSSMFRNDMLPLLFVALTLLLVTKKIFDKRTWLSVALGINSKLTYPAPVALLFLTHGVNKFFLFTAAISVSILPFALYTYFYSEWGILGLNYWRASGIGVLYFMYDSTLFYMIAVCLYAIVRKEVNGWKEPMAVIIGTLIFYEIVLGRVKVTSYLIPAYFASSIIISKFLAPKSWKAKALVMSILSFLYVRQAIRPSFVGAYLTPTPSWSIFE